MEATTLGRIASYYYLSHETLLHFDEKLNGNMTIDQILEVRNIERLTLLNGNVMPFYRS